MSKAMVSVMVAAQRAINDTIVQLVIHNQRNDESKLEGVFMDNLINSSVFLNDAIEKVNVKPEVTKLSADDEIARFLEGVVGCVEANSFEKHSLWKENHYLADDARHKREWKDNNSGYGITIGCVDDRPVHLSLRIATIDGQKILFYYATSQVVDHKMIREWLEVNLPDTAKGNYPGGYNNTDATNFHNVFRRK